MKRLVYLVIFILVFSLMYCGDDASKDSSGNQFASDKEKLNESTYASKDEDSKDKAKKTKQSTANPNDYLVEDLQIRKKSYMNTDDSKNVIRNASDLKKVLEDNFYKPENFKDVPQKKWVDSEDLFEKHQNK